MTSGHLTEEDVTRAASVLVEAFRATDTRAYFGCFAEDATFVFHTEDRRLDSRGAYEQLWAQWLDGGWRVIGCTSSNSRVQLLGDVAIFTHDVRTTTSTGGDPETTHERETIVFHRSGDALRAVHEHLSPVPDDGRE
ncbi:YybH family protein [Arthrobacter sedimenti]|uniref:YybH family protein n=1 Tax=Arthrobacter sedimenti TaxID=2694931 RepID=UPI000B57D208|nr:nuclear transport factor 2 family protein [Arthrobacter sedimenti]OUM41782.1 DUF4440 domain-containing protein [Arthrobacter agilis]